MDTVAFQQRLEERFQVEERWGQNMLCWGKRKEQGAELGGNRYVAENGIQFATTANIY